MMALSTLIALPIAIHSKTPIRNILIQLSLAFADTISARKKDDMTVSGRLSEAISTTQGRLTRTIEHVLRLWIPVNSKTLEYIKEGISSGRYRGNRKQLNQDLKSDISLYTWCLRRLCEISELDPERDHAFDPLTSLEQLEIGNLEFILDVNPNEISQHSLSMSDDKQLQLMRESLYGASAVEVLSEEKGGDRRAYGAMMLRQLGITLIAWNYPEIFSEVMEEVKKGKELDTEMAKRIGFSPSLLASGMVESWGVSKNRCFSLGLSSSDQNNSTQKNFLHKICDFGEKLVRANNPEIYPQAKGEWSNIETQIKSVIGEDGVRKIQDRFQVYSSKYQEVMPQFISRNPETSSPHQVNSFIESCEESLKQTLINLYSELSKKIQSHHELLTLLVREIIPVNGFTGGCVYTVDPTLGKLIPQLQFGSLKLHKAGAIDYLSPTSKNIIVSAFEKYEIQKVNEIANGEQKFLGMAHGIGNKRRVGVLYLEQPGNDDPYSIQQQITHFRAFEKTLTDCLS